MRIAGSVGTVCAMAAAKTDDDYLEEARWICRRVPTVWFSTEQRYDPTSRVYVPLYRIYRRGMGSVATRSTASALVAYLRKQLPVEAPSQ